MYPEKVALINKCANCRDRHYLGEDLASENYDKNEGGYDGNNSDQLHNNRRRSHRQKHIYVIGQYKECGRQMKKIEQQKAKPGYT
jgi:hypothetical protein